MRANDTTSGEKPELKPERSEGPTLAFIRRLPGGVFEQAKRTIARAVTDFWFAITAPPRVRPDRGRLYLHPVPVFHRHDLRSRRSAVRRGEAARRTTH